MKLKLLLMPILLVLIVVMAIWWIYPGYQDLKMKEDELAAVTAKLTSVKEKNAKAAILNDTWNNSSEQRSFIEKYIPEKKQEEDVISTLNSLVSDAGLALFNLSVSATEKKDVSSVERNKIDEELEAGAVSSAPKDENFNVALGVVGDYVKIKTLLGKVGSLTRFNNISSLNIAKVSSSGQAEGGSGILQADIILNFNYMKKSSSVVQANNAIFLTGAFDMGIVDEIIKKLSTDVKITTIESAGRENPFVK